MPAEISSGAGATSRLATRAIFEFVEADLAAQGVAVDPQDPGGARLVAVRAVQHALDEFLLELGDGLVEQDPAFHHLADQRLELVFHGRTLRKNKVGSLPGSVKRVRGPSA